MNFIAKDETNEAEILFIGHPAVGTAFVLFHQKIIKSKNEGFFLFEEGVGNIKVEIQFKNRQPAIFILNQPLPHYSARPKNSEIRKCAVIASDPPTGGKQSFKF